MKFLFFGKNGEIEDDDNFDGRPPLVEIDLGVNMGGFVAETKKPMRDFVRDQVEKHYKQSGRFGLYGDAIQVTCIQVDKGYVYSCDFIGRLAFHKPGLAADLVLFLEDCDRKLFFVGIMRKKNPDKPALPGGFRNVIGRHFETGAEAVIRESGEEIKLEMEAIYPEKVKKDTEIKAVPVRVRFGEKDHSVLMQRIGNFQTSDEEAMPYSEFKRVYETTAYGLRLWLHEESLTKEKIADWLKAGDDAASLVIVEMGEEDVPEFVFGHHKTIFEEAMRKMGITRKLEMRKKQKGVLV